MKTLIVLLICAGIGYAAEVYFENPQDYVVWIGFTVITFAVYVYLTKITSFAFALPVATVSVGFASTFAYIKGQPGLVIFGAYAAMGTLILLGDRFRSWSWANWKSPTKFFKVLTATSRKNF
jgi:hypothetical protein